jgi:hypothetical protein
MRGLTRLWFTKTYTLDAVNAYGFLGSDAFDHECEFLRQLQGRDLVPELNEATAADAVGRITIAAHQPLRWWLAEHREPEALAIMHSALENQIIGLHAMGVCHGDIHVYNVVVRDDGLPLLIDFELATRTDSRRACFDLVGPSDDVEVPIVHREHDLTEGVWWDTASRLVPSLGRALGPRGSLPAASGAVATES